MQRVFLATHSSKWNKGLLGEYLNKKVLTWKIDKMSFMYEFKNSITEMCWIQFLPWVKSWLICSKLFVHRHSTFFLPSSTPICRKCMTLFWVGIEFKSVCPNEQQPLLFGFFPTVSDSLRPRLLCAQPPPPPPPPPAYFNSNTPHPSHPKSGQIVLFVCVLFLPCVLWGAMMAAV